MFVVRKIEQCVCVLPAEATFKKMWSELTKKSREISLCKFNRSFLEIKGGTVQKY